MISDNKPFDTNCFFSGGAGLFIQYHDIIKPVYLYAIIQMIMTGQSFGLPINIIKDMPIVSLIEWYIYRRFRNPLKQLDYNNKIDIKVLDDIMKCILANDPSIYRISPVLNIQKMMQVYKLHHMNFPIYIYSEYEESSIVDDCDQIFNGIKHHYFFGDLKKSITKCDQNFTYIFSDIETVNKAAEILIGTYSHILLARDYRYNYIDNRKTLKYDIKNIADTHPFLRLGTTLVMDPKEVILSYAKLLT